MSITLWSKTSIFNRIDNFESKWINIDVDWKTFFKRRKIVVISSVKMKNSFFTSVCISRNISIEKIVICEYRWVNRRCKFARFKKIWIFLKSFNLNHFRIVFIRRKLIFISSTLIIKFRYLIFFTKNRHFFRLTYKSNFLNRRNTSFIWFTFVIRF